MRHYVKFCADWLNRWGNMAVFRFSRWRSSAILDFQKLEILTAHTLRRPKNASSCRILCKSVKALRRYGRFRFFKMAAVRHLGFVILLFGPPTKCILLVFVTAKFGLNRCSSFDNMQVLIFWVLSLKMPIHAHFWGVFGAKMGEHGNFVYGYPSRNASHQKTRTLRYNLSKSVQRFDP